MPDAPESLETSNVTEVGVSLKWKVPKSDGGKEIFNFVVEKRETKKGQWIKATKV